ncbi:MAG: hypothetical protein HQ575_03395 [Candidatus Omnitrophica bacterium]|nr:hypothetical protein [Candidatus Omnitrophota bacterium]
MSERNLHTFASHGWLFRSAS